MQRLTTQADCHGFHVEPSGFIKLPKSAFFLLSTLMMNQEDNFLNINDKPINL
ncbi:hypothetical protein BFK02_004549 [Salmonella enterica subsp. enterica serovar Java]|nr:hypothetical protein [Salmonella enterica subsp. enterica serovar Java]EGI5335880.1 hypothetical protein [Salmonella enterica subsp. enterica serovar Caracas]